MYARVYHRIALHLEDVGGFFVGHQVFVEIHYVEELFFGGGRKSRLDDTEQPHARRELTGSEVAAFVFDDDAVLHHFPDKFEDGILGTESREAHYLLVAGHTAILLVERYDGGFVGFVHAYSISEP